MQRVAKSVRRLGRATLFTLFAALATVATASSVRTLNLEQMAQRAATIFHGRCVEIRVEADAGLGREVTVVKFEVQRLVKGRASRNHTIRLLGAGGAPSKSTVAGLPTFRVGEELVVFLYGESRAGLTSPVGFGQGKFLVMRDKLGRPLAVNESGNAHLWRALSNDGAARLDGIGPAWRQQRAVSPDLLLDMAESLQRTTP